MADFNLKQRYDYLYTQTYPSVNYSIIDSKSGIYRIEPEYGSEFKLYIIIIPIKTNTLIMVWRQETYIYGFLCEGISTLSSENILFLLDKLEQIDKFKYTILFDDDSGAKQTENIRIHNSCVYAVSTDELFGDGNIIMTLLNPNNNLAIDSNSDKHSINGLEFLKFQLLFDENTINVSIYEKTYKCVANTSEERLDGTKSRIKFNVIEESSFAVDLRESPYKSLPFKSQHDSTVRTEDE